ncbi:hypothetical protein DSO57_1015206 [Entomophthora muscae]|uniref:Uncharacterized protein n=1 Tax=Entomophthora muscae TaxID=34485 RepID=A0ACC2RWE3_9FUNG|nr:hypothetical protein DSO57_1015206 [Entomophthora muscae]
MATPQQETFLPIPKGDIPNGYIIYQDQLVLISVYNWLCLGQHDASVTLHQSDLSVKTQKLREYFSKVGYQVGNLEPCERRHNGIDHHHPSKDLGVYVKSSKITGKVRKHIEYKGVYCYMLGGAGQHQCGPGVRLRGV